jgi:hypothetical protein
MRGAFCKQRRYPGADKDMVDKLHTTRLFMYFGLHTHDFTDKIGKGSYDHFGLYTVCCAEDLNARVVALAWAVGSCDTTPTMKSFVFKQDGVRISHKAATYHGIDDRRMDMDGHSGRAVLKEFIEDARRVVAQGGRLVAHHLGYLCLPDPSICERVILSRLRHLQFMM